jgi:hypothetical protein
MGSSTIKLAGRGFEANDSTLEIWLALLIDEIDERADAPGWLRETREAWEVMATQHFGFGVVLGLDEIASDAQRRDLLLGVAHAALARLRSFGPSIPVATLNGLRDWGHGYEYTHAVAAEHFLLPAEYFIKLLEGHLGPDEIDARILEPR